MLTELFVGHKQRYWYVMREVLKGLVFMHVSQHLHRDIKSNNDLITQDGEIKLPDLGLL